MTMNIGETLLNNPEDGKLHFFGQIREIRRNVELGINFTAFGESLDIPAKGRSEPRFIQQRRMQQIGNGTNLLTCLLDQGSVFGDPFGRIRAQLMRLRVHYKTVQDRKSTRLNS